MQPDYELSDPPSDGISCVSFAPKDPQILCVSGWDKSVRVYDVKNNILRAKYDHQAPVLSTSFGSDDDHVYSGGLDRRLKMYDLNVMKETVLGKHDDAIRVVDYNHMNNKVITGSWDKTVRTWDPRSTSAATTTELPSKVLALSTASNKIVVCMSQRQIHIYDVRNMSEVLQQRESSLKFMTRIAKCMPNGEGFASGSIEGRVAVEFFDPDEKVQSKKYAFKCHRSTSEGFETVYPVNALAYHPIYGTFATGGADGFVSTWDGFNKKKLKQFQKYPASIASLAFNSTGTLLAVASSYTFEDGEKDSPPDSVYIRTILDADVKPKSVPAS
ncbi:hypothetical protein SeMB42_g07677 [Synchytrium endobioticum]|uniref:Uncharacterized protein n=1 Tax=Synchytrium endobioticum TaxID=286115 RepID=A0A507DJP6_9FUNG|nr:hypothetical protein SeMB42_g07677 [Synchytrium endobioticum]TPX51843.1 hypothetical protein SeLEV6574_g00008 [Synchytrium endobioticum]